MEAGDWKLKLYMVSTTVVASPLLVALAVQAALHGGGQLNRQVAPATLVFCLVLIVGELFPIPVARGAEAGDEITVSSTFGFAILLIAPLAYAVAAQTIALGIDCIIRGRPRSRLPFNISQYALAFMAARAAYAFMTGQRFILRGDPGAPHLLPALVATIAFLLVNNCLVAGAISLSVRMHLHRVLIGDIAWQIWTSAPLLGLGVVAADLATWNAISIVLLLAPILALHRSGHQAMQREQEALRDRLTGLANRGMLDAATTRALTEGSGKLAMILLDLDHFKDINDTLGHAVGDEMLLSVASRLDELAESGDLVGRLGGDEFVILRRRATTRAEVTEFANRVCTQLSKPVVLHGVTLSVGCSVGIALAPEHADTLTELLRCADIAMYTAKSNRGEVAVYDKDSDPHSVALLGLHADLRASLESEFDQQIWVAYQPQLDVRTGRVSSVECLARWLHPQAGPVRPDVFVPIAENTALINDLLYRVLDVALVQLCKWDSEGFQVAASINLTARQISDLGLPATIERHLDRYGVDPARLVFEVTESRLMANPENSVEVLQCLHKMGARLSIDDFGTGYSSLAYLQRLSVDELKIDKSFIAEMGRSGDTTIVRSTIDLGHNLGLKVVAEGVEDFATAAELKRLGCDLLQGYLVGTPMHAAELPQHLERMGLNFQAGGAATTKSAKAALATIAKAAIRPPALMRGA